MIVVASFQHGTFSIATLDVSPILKMISSWISVFASSMILIYHVYLRYRGNWRHGHPVTHTVAPSPYHRDHHL